MSEANRSPRDSKVDPRRPGRGPVLASVALHVVALVATWWSQRALIDPFEYETYQFELITVGDPDLLELAGAPEPPVVVPQEDPPPPEPTPEPPPPDPDPLPPPPEPEPEPEPDPEPEPTPAEPQPTTPSPPPQPVVERPPVSTEPASAAEMNVRMEGLRRDFPEYYQRIVQEVGRCWRPNEVPGSGTVVLRFEIQRDGRISGSSIRVFNSSGNRALDIYAVGAVECAGRGIIGPLPSDMPSDILPVQFTFSPRGGPGGQE